MLFPDYFHESFTHIRVDLNRQCVSNLTIDFEIKSYPATFLDFFFLDTDYKISNFLISPVLENNWKTIYPSTSFKQFLRAICNTRLIEIPSLK